MSYSDGDSSADTDIAVIANNNHVVSKTPITEKTEDSNTSRIEYSRKQLKQHQHPKPQPHPMQIIWSHTIFYLILHVAAVVGMFRLPQTSAWTLVFAAVWHAFGGLGVTAGAHRLWAHRSYRAAWPLRVMLILMYTVAAQTHLVYWVRNHRIHHRYSETEGDPHDARRGFLFSHFTWLIVKKHPICQQLYESVDVSDLYDDPVVRVHMRYYWLLTTLLGFGVPALLPWWLWQEHWSTGLLVAGALRYTVTFHSTWLVNSAAHMWGCRPYDASIGPTENGLVAALAGGEGWHNYHHSFPWDYRTGEVPGLGNNLTRSFIDRCADMGLVWDRKTANEKIVQQRATRLGDGSQRPTKDAL